MKMKKQYIFKIKQTWLWSMMLLMLLTFNVEAQDGNVVTGQVIDEEDAPLIGVTILVKGTQRGTVTDVDGNFSIKVKSSDVLVLSFVGYKPTEITVGSQTKINVKMDVDQAQLEELVVIGYGTMKKSNVTGAVSKVTNEKLDQIPLGRVDDAFVGLVSGLTVASTNPAAGEAPTIRIRGQGSLSFDSNPLIVIDGVVVGNDSDFLSSIDMNDVASIEVLKDAAAAAIYGSRGANGVILISSKQGLEGPTRFSYNAYIGFKSVPDNDYLTGISDWNSFVESENGGVLTDRLKYINLLGTNTDWQDVMMDGGTIQSHSLSARGGTKNTKYRASVNYLDDEGVLLTDNYKKINFRLNLDTKINDRIEFGVALNPSWTEQRRFPIGLHDALRQSPWLPLYLDENNIQFVNRFRENGRWADAQIGDYAMERMFDDFDLETGLPDPGLSGTDISTTSNQNPYAKVVEQVRMKNETKILGNTYLKFKLLDGLKFKQSIGGDFRQRTNTNWTGVNATRNGAGDAGSDITSYQQLHIVTESILTYNKEINKHSISAVAGFAYEQWDREWVNLEATGYTSDNIQTIPAANVSGGYTLEAQEKLVSYFGRVNYAFDNKYLLSVSARMDGSSKFGPDSKFGFFPAVSAGWNVAEEEFLKGSSVISEMKIRASYGATGSNSGIGEYDHIGLLSPVGTAVGGGQIGFNPSNISNTDLRWEKLVEFNPGIDVQLLRGRFQFSIDYYQRRSKDLLLQLPVPSVTGFETALVNQGEVENKGVEFEFTSKNIDTKAFGWNTTINVSRNVNTLIDFAGSSGLISIVDDKRPAEWVALEGQPISSFYGYVVSHEIEPEFIKNPFYPIGSQSQDVYVKDLNGDGVIDTDDRTILGSPYPDIVWSIANSFTFNNFDVSFMFQGSHGAEVRNISSQYIKNEFAGNQDYVDGFADAALVKERIFTNDDVQDASYIALRNFNVGYTLPKKLTKKIGFRKVRVYTSAQNLLYLMSSDYQGFNPEGIDQGRDSPLTYGYQRGPAPIYRTFAFGFNLQF